MENNALEEYVRSVNTMFSDDYPEYSSILGNSSYESSDNGLYDDSYAYPEAATIYADKSVCNLLKDFQGGFQTRQQTIVGSRVRKTWLALFELATAIQFQQVIKIMLAKDFEPWLWA